MARGLRRPGQVWKVRASFLIPVPETGACDNPALVQYDPSPAVLFDQAGMGASKDMVWAVEADEPKYKDASTPRTTWCAISDR